MQIIMKECMGADKKIQILLSTYNGEKYLREQLESYLKLEGFENIKVLIRDDGSTDHTMEILDEYKAKYGFEVEAGENLGVNDSIFWLFTHCDLSCDYFALSDQDDVWLSNKFTMALNKLQTIDKNIPALFGSCSQITDRELKPKGSTTRPIKGVGFYNAIAQNVCPGHTQVFNRALLKHFIPYQPDKICVIDWWIYLVASGLGKVVFDNGFTVLHRQHGDNSIGYRVGFFPNLWQRLKKVKNGKGNQISLQLLSFLQIYGDKLPLEYYNEIECYFSCQSNFFARMYYALIGKAYRQTYLETLIFKMLFVLGKYKV